MGTVYTDEYLDQVFSSIDADGGGTLDYVEFSDMITGADERTRVSKEMIQDQIKQLKRLFRYTGSTDCCVHTDTHRGS